MKLKHIFIYTDGACKGNPGIGGWAAILRYGEHEKILSGTEAHTTNNRMELLGPIKALATLKQPCEVEIYTDSQYVQKGITQWLNTWKAKNWKKADRKEVKNADLWQALDKEASRHKIKWHWVRGHSGHPENELADSIANLAIDNMKKERK